MKNLLSAIFVLFSVFVVSGANPDFRGFLGTNGIIIRTNPATGVVQVDGKNVGYPSTNTATAITNLLWHQTLFVDATNGNDSTYVIGDASKPARTLETAFAAVQNNMMLYFRPGFYMYDTFPALLESTNAIPFYGKTNVYIYGPGSVWYVSNPSTMISMGFCTNITFDGMTMIGVRDESLAGMVDVQHAAVWIEGDCSDITFKNMVVKNWLNQGIATYRHPDHLWGYRNIRVVDSHFEWIGFTNFSATLANDGTAIVICGDDTVVARNTFRFNLRDFETFTHSDAIPDQVWRNGQLIGNISIGCMEQFYAQGATNIQDWLIADNNVYMFQTNRQLVAAAQYAMRLYGGENVIIENNMIHGAQYGIELVPASGGVFGNIQIKNNSIVATDVNAFSGFARLNGDPGRHLKHIYIEGNNIVQCGGFGIIAGFSHGTIKDNVWLDMGTNGACNRVIYTSGTDYPCGGFFDTIPCTNLVVSGNWIGHRNQGAGYTDDTIHIGNRTYGAYVDGNFLATDVNPIVNVGNNTVGLLALAGGNNFNDYIGGSTVAGAPWVRTNSTTGQGTWGTDIVVYDVQIISANDSVWQITSPVSDNLWFTNSGLGVPIHLDVGNNGIVRLAEGPPWQAVSVPTNLWASRIVVTNDIASSNVYAANFIQTNGYNRDKFYHWGGTNVQWRMVKNITLTNVVDVSAAAYYPSNGTFFTIHNNSSGRITEWTLDGVFVRKIDGTGSGLADCESIVYMGGDRFAIVEEDLNNIYNISVSGRASGSTWATNESQMFELPASIGVDASGSGVEGIAYDWDRNLWWVAKEKNPAQLLIVTNSAGVWYTNNWFTTAQMQTFTNANNTDFSDLFLDRENQILWVAQDEGAAIQTDRVIGIDLLTSNVIATISVTNFGQLEGVSMTPDGRLLVSGEANKFAIFEPVLGGLNSGISWQNFPFGNTNAPAAPMFPFGTITRSNASYADNLVVTGNVTHPIAVIAGAGSGSTNYTLLANRNMMFAGSSNVNVVAAMNYTAGVANKWTAIFTNLSASTWGIQFSAATNEWSFWNFNYGTNPPSVLTNGFALRIEATQIGTNVYATYNYHRPIKP